MQGLEGGSGRRCDWHACDQLTCTQIAQLTGVTKEDVVRSIAGSMSLLRSAGRLARHALIWELTGAGEEPFERAGGRVADRD